MQPNVFVVPHVFKIQRRFDTNILLSLRKRRANGNHKYARIMFAMDLIIGRGCEKKWIDEKSMRNTLAYKNKYSAVTLSNQRPKHGTWTHKARLQGQKGENVSTTIILFRNRLNFFSKWAFNTRIAMPSSYVCREKFPTNPIYLLYVCVLSCSFGAVLLLSFLNWYSRDTWQSVQITIKQHTQSCTTHTHAHTDQSLTKALKIIRCHLFWMYVCVCLCVCILRTWLIERKMTQYNII